MTPHVIRCAIHKRGGPVCPIPRNEKISAAAAIHPDPAPSISPCAAGNASCFAPLAHQANTKARVGGTPVEVHVIRRAIHMIFLAEAGKLWTSPWRFCDLRRCHL